MSSVVSPATLKQYREQMGERGRRRGKKQREEKRREKRIDLEERKMMGRYGQGWKRVESEYHYPAVSDGGRKQSEGEDFPTMVAGEEGEGTGGYEEDTGFSFARVSFPFFINLYLYF